MSEATLHATIVELVAAATEQPASELSAGSRFADMPRWTSFVSVLVLNLVEERTGVRLDLRRYLAGDTVGDLVAMVAAARA